MKFCFRESEYPNFKVTVFMFPIYLYRYVKPFVFYNASFGEGTGPIYFLDLACIGNGTFLPDCRYTASSSYTHYADVSVFCAGKLLFFVSLFSFCFNLLSAKVTNVVELSSSAEHFVLMLSHYDYSDVRRTSVFCRQHISKMTSTPKAVSQIQ